MPGTPLPPYRICRLLPLILLAIPSGGCGEAYTPAQAGVPGSAFGAGRYPLRTDLMVVGSTGIPGAPRHWPSAGFPPLKSARLPGLTPDPDIAEDIRKELGKNVLDPTTDLSPSQKATFTRLLDRVFGVPASPTIAIPTWEELTADGAADAKTWDAAKWSAAATAATAGLNLDSASLTRGSLTYRRLCLQCHGLTGAGDGAHAIELFAMPRDYRQGIFKFITAFPQAGPQKKGLSPSGKPRREDLRRTIRRGLDGSMMPAFATLSDAELDDLVSYVIHLSVRGETEFATMKRVMQPADDDPDFDGPLLERLLVQNLLAVLDNWGLAARSPIPIPPDHASTADDRLLSAFRGYKLYHSAEFGCAACHVNFGREPALKWDLWGTVVQPRNLVLGVYRGGRRGEDLYARLYGGIYPSGMTAFHPTLNTGPSYPDRPNKLWNVVHFLQALGDPADRQRLTDPAVLARFKERLRTEGDNSLDDLAGVKIDP